MVRVYWTLWIPLGWCRWNVWIYYLFDINLIVSRASYRDSFDIGIIINALRTIWVATMHGYFAVLSHLKEFERNRIRFRKSCVTFHFTLLMPASWSNVSSSIDVPFSALCTYALKKGISDELLDYVQLYTAGCACVYYLAYWHAFGSGLVGRLH